MKIKYLLTLSIFSLLISISSCCNKSTETAVYKLSDYDKSFIPYLPDQTVTFVHSNGHQFNMTVTNVFTYSTRTFTEHCNDDYVTYEYMVSEMSSADPQLYISLMVTPQDYSPNLLITINNDHFNLPTDSEPEIDSISIGGFVYTDVYKMAKDINDTTIITPKEVLFNKTFGIIQIKLTNNEEFNYVP